MDGGETESLRDLAARVIDNGKAYLRAELTLVRQTIATKAALIGPADSTLKSSFGRAKFLRL